MTLESKLNRILPKFGDFSAVSKDEWIQEKFCEICLEVHVLRRVLATASQPASDIYQSSPVRLSDGLTEVQIYFDQTCAIQGFKNLTKTLAEELRIPVITDYQVFDSAAHLLDSLRFSLPGHFYEWDGVELSDWESWLIKQGYLLKLHFQRSWDSPIVDLAIDFHEYNDFKTEQFGLTAGVFGVLATFWGAPLQELDFVAELFQRTLEDYFRLLHNLHPQSIARVETQDELTEY